MNQVFVCAQLSEAPREVFISANQTAIRCQVTLPPVGNKAPTQLEYNCYGKTSERFRVLPKGALVYIHGAKLRFDLESKTYSLHGGIAAQVTEAFPILNTVILSGRCVKDIDQQDARAFKTTADGLMICNQTLAVSTGRAQSDLFNFYAINSSQDKLNQAELLLNFTRKGTGLTINGRLVTDAWVDKETKERRSITKMQLVSMTLAPKGSDSGQQRQVVSQTTVASEEGVASLWGGRSAEDSADPWTQSSGGGLPELPGQYGPTPTFDDDNHPF
jgi:single-stranded DNA-binding protein